MTAVLKFPSTTTCAGLLGKKTSPLVTGSTMVSWLTRGATWRLSCGTWPAVLRAHRILLASPWGRRSLPRSSSKHMWSWRSRSSGGWCCTFSSPFFVVVVVVVVVAIYIKKWGRGGGGAVQILTQEAYCTLKCVSPLLTDVCLGY